MLLFWVSGEGVPVVMGLLMRPTEKLVIWLFSTMAMRPPLMLPPPCRPAGKRASCAVVNGPDFVPLASVTICVNGSHVGLPPAFHSSVVSRGVMALGRR